MANYHSIKNPVPTIEGNLEDGVFLTVFPPEWSVNEDIYALMFEGESEWTGEFEKGDLFFIDPHANPSKGDFAAIYIEDEGGEPYIELIGLGICPQPSPNPGEAIPHISISRPGNILRMVSCEKIDKVHKIIAKFRAVTGMITC